MCTCAFECLGRYECAHMPMNKFVLEYLGGDKCAPIPRYMGTCVLKCILAYLGRYERALMPMYVYTCLLEYLGT